MEQPEQIRAFSNDLEALIERYAKEFDLTNAAAIGVLRLCEARLLKRILEDEDDNSN